MQLSGEIRLLGSMQLIENNIIIFHVVAAAPSAAPIKLRFASGSIIRNNLIIVEGRTSETPEAAINLIDSTDVVIENNQIFGVSKVWKDWDGNSSVRESNTISLKLAPFVSPFDVGVR